MEVSPPPQSVQINFNNKIITLHNVTILKNPKIITIDASQYSNFLKGGSPVKLLNGGSTSPVKLSSLVPVRTDVAKKLPEIKQFSPNQRFPAQVPSTVCSTINPIRLQPVPSTKPQPSVIISPPVTTLPGNHGQVRIGQTIVINKPSMLPMNKIPTKVIVKSPVKREIQIQVPPVLITPPSKPLQIGSKDDVRLPPLPSTKQEKPNTAFPTKVIISPPLKNKISPCSISPPEAKRTCTKLDFHCIFCDNIYNDSSDLIEHMSKEHEKSMETPTKEPEVAVKSVIVEATVKSSTVQEPDPVPAAKELKPESSAKHVDGEEYERNYEDEDESGDDSLDDDSEVNDLLVDLDETTQGSSQARSDTPESPQFEEHIPSSSTSVKQEDMDEISSPELDDQDFEDYEYYSNIMEPICQLSCDEDSNDDEPKENEAMRLYREAMEMNYQQNGIKKRGRRKPRSKTKPLEENSINSILAGLLENNSVMKVPPGPGRGRRKEMKEEELEMERVNGTCLFSCNKCDETFKYAGDLAKHVRSHTISSPYQCTICQRKFTHIGSLNTHLRIHSGERPYKCNQCEKSFTQSNSLMVHVKSHLSNKPFQCLQCNKGFQNASSLALHQKTHNGPSETVVCPIDDCGKEFRDKNLLEEHLMTHRNSLLYQCSLCSEKFDQSCLLVQHVKKHVGDKPFQCNQCGKCFTQPGSLNTHLRIHTGEKPFKCEVCGKNFTQASSLSVHSKVHGEKQFKCVVDGCKKSFGQEVTLRKHMQKHIANFNDENSQMKQE